MFRSTLLLSFLCAVIGASACDSEPSQPARPESAPQQPKVAPPVPSPPASQIPAPELHRRWEITVNAGARAREALLVSARLDGTPTVKSALVRAPKGALVPSQMQPDGQVVFRINSMKAGAQAIFLAEEGEAPAAHQKGGVLAVQDPDGVKLTIDGKPILTYQTQRPAAGKDIAPEYGRTGYLHPLYSPAGVLVTDDYPPDKPYQHGIWSGWEKVESGGAHQDFWDTGRRKGRAAMESVAPLWGGPLQGGFGSHQIFADMDSRPGATILREGWSVVAFRNPGRESHFLVDLESTQAVLASPATLGENPFGGITIRGNRDWQGASRSIFLTSEGQSRAKAQGAAAHWCYLGGKSGGKMAGVAILSHPQNSAKSEAVFIDPEAPVMGFAPTKNGSITLLPGKPLKLRYRFVVLDGKPEKKLLDHLWDDFANPPAVEVRLLAGK